MLMKEFAWGDGATGFVDAGGKRLEVASWGPPPGQAPTIAMLHEGLGCVALWRDFPEKLAAATGWGVLAYSRAGHGQSDPADLPRPLDFMTREAVEVLPQVLEAAGVETAVLLGHSDGATISAIYAGSVSDMRIRGLVLVAPHFFTEETGLAEIAKAREAYESGDLKARMARFHADPENTFRGWNDTWLNPDFKDWNVAEVIDYLRIPALAVQGEDDQYGTRSQINELESRSYAPVEVVMIPGCRHAPHIEAQDALMAAVTEFIARLARIEAAQPEMA
jgi:pimeloyl-ACP methyl ester carboxylesterase